MIYVQDMSVSMRSLNFVIFNLQLQETYLLHLLLPPPLPPLLPHLQCRQA